MQDGLHWNFFYAGAACGTFRPGGAPAPSPRTKAPEMNTLRRILSPLALGLSIAGFTGCGGGVADAPARTSVSGTVTLDGKPLSTGEIKFVPVDGKGTTDAGFIKDGKFTVQVAAGERKVEISSQQELPTKAPDGLPNYGNVIPKEYNNESKTVVKFPTKETLKYDIVSTPAGKAAPKK